MTGGLALVVLAPRRPVLFLPSRVVASHRPSLARLENPGSFNLAGENLREELGAEDHEAPGAGASTHAPFRATRRDRLAGRKSRCPLRGQEARRRCCVSRGVAWRWRGCGRVRRGLRVAPHAGCRVAPEGLHQDRRGPPAWTSCSRHTPSEWHTGVAHRVTVRHCTFWLTYREQDVASGAGGARKPQCTLIYVYFVVFHIFVYMVCHLRHYPTRSGQIRGFVSGAPPENCAISVPLCATHLVLSPFQNRRPPEPL